MINKKAAHEDGMYPLFSSRGTRWDGLVVEKLQTLSADRPRSIEVYEPRAGYILSRTELRWAARGIRHKVMLKPDIALFFKEGYRLDDWRADTSHYDCVCVKLEREKIAALVHDDVRSTRIDFLEQVTSNDDQMIGMINAMYAEARAGSPAGALFSQSISIALLAHLYDRYDRTSAARRLEGRLSARQDEIITRYVSEHIGDDMSIAELAGLLNLSPAYFSKAFAKTRGVTPHRFILNARIVFAMEKLRQPSAPSLAELASSLGFANQGHFGDVFRKIVGCSPSEFRKRSK